MNTGFGPLKGPDEFLRLGSLTTVGEVLPTVVGRKEGDAHFIASLKTLYELVAGAWVQASSPVLWVGPDAPTDGSVFWYDTDAVC